MKEIIIISLALILVFPLFGEENIVTKTNKIYHSRNFSIIKFSPGLLIGASIGYGKQDTVKGKNVEYIFNLYYNQGAVIEKMKVGGLYLQYNVYIRENRKGIYTILNLGIGYAVINDKKERLVPNVSLGLGYNLPINEKSFLRFEIDGGIKLYIATLSFAIVF